MTRTLSLPRVYARPDLCPQCWTRLDDTTCSRCGLVLDGPDARELLHASRLVDFWLDRRSRELTALRTGGRPGGPSPQPAPRLEKVPVVYARTDLCPQCWSVLAGPHCQNCGLRLLGPAARAVWEAGRHLDGWLAVRAGLMDRLRDRARRQPDLPEPAVPQEAGQVPPPAPPRPPAPARQPWWSRWNITPQAILLGLGALLVGVSAVIFLLVTWDLLGIEGRSVVLGSVTALTVAVAVTTRRRLPVTAEAFGALSVVLLALDVVALRATELFAASIPWADYTAAAAFVVALACIGLARVTGLRAFAHGAGVLLPVTAALVGHALSQVPGSPGASLFLLGAGALAGLMIGMLALHRRERLGWPAVISYGTGLALQVITLITLFLLCVVFGELTWLGALLGVVALTAALHAVLLPAGRPGASIALGLSAPLAMALPVLDHVPTWWVLAAPMLIGAFVMGLVLLRTSLPRGLHGRATGISALIMLACWVAPGAVLTGQRAAGSLVAAVRPWTVSPGSPWAEVAAGVPSDNFAVAGLGACLVGCITLFVWGRAGSSAARQTSVVLLAAVTLTLPWWHQLPVLAVVVAGVLCTVGLILGGRLLAGHPDYPHSTLHLTGAGALLAVCTVIAAWTSEPLTVATTLLATAGLVFWWTRIRHPLLWAPAMAALLLSACALASSAGLLTQQFGFVAAWTSLAVISVQFVLPGTWLDPRNRMVLGACAVAGAGLGAVWQLGMLAADVPVPDGAALATWTCLSALLCAVAVAVDPRRLLPGNVRVAAVPVTVATGIGLGLSAHEWAGLAQPALASALAAALGAVALVALRVRRMGLPAQVAVLEWSLATGAGLSLVLLGYQAQAWPTLLVLGAGTALVALLPQRRDMGWAAWALITWAWWDLLAATSLRTVEWFVLPAAVVLLAAGGWAARADGRVLRPSLVAGSALMVLPTAVASVSGGPWRAVAVVLTGLGFALGTVLLRRSSAPQPWHRAPHVAAPAVALAMFGPWLRGVDGLPSGPGNDLLVLGSAAALTLLGWALWSRPWSIGLGMMLAVLPLLIVVGGPTQLLWRTWVLILITGTVLTVAQGVRLQPGPSHGLGWLMVSAGSLLTVGTAVGAVGQLILPGGHALESATVPAAAVLLVVGVLRMRATTEGSWRMVGPALLLGLVPSVLLGLGGGSVVRVLLLTVACALLVVLGIRLRWQAMILVGAGVLVVHGVTQLAPWFVLVYATVPRWAHLAVVGGVLLILGARYEHRMADVRMMRRRLQELR